MTMTRERPPSAGCPHQPTGTIIPFRPRPAVPAPALLSRTEPPHDREWPDEIRCLPLPERVAAVLIRTPSGTVFAIDSVQTERAAWLAIGMALGESRRAEVAVVMREDVTEAEKRFAYLRALPWLPSA